MTVPFLKKLLAASALCSCVTSLAFANMVVSFDEGAPKDRFTFKNASNCTIDAAKLTLDLSGSKSGLIFDVTGSGAGVEVFQPLVITSGASALRGVPKVSDGDNRIILDIRELKANQSISFTIDVDDTTGGREITVSDSEILGAKVQFSQASQVTDAVFGSNARATVQLKSC